MSTKNRRLTSSFPFALRKFTWLVCGGLFSALLLLTGCKKDNLCDCFKGTGNDIASDRAATPFQTIQVEGKIDLVLTQDTIERITVVAGKHLINNIETSISNNTLFIRNHNICNFVRSLSRKITVYVSVNQFNHLIYKSAGDVTTTNTIRSLEADSTLTIESADGSGEVHMTVNARVVNATISSGPGDIYLSGNAHVMSLYGTGLGAIHTENMLCPTVYLTNDAVSDMYVSINSCTTSYLNAQVFNNGNVYCKGHPGKLVKWERSAGKLYFQ
jgi:hypothetical protein